MSSQLSRHFEDLRNRFSDNSAPLLASAQHGFETMRQLTLAQRPPGCRTASFEIDGTDFLVWEMDEKSDRFHVFASIYTVSIGILCLSSQPSGVLVVHGYYVDLSKLAEQIRENFHAAGTQISTSSERKQNILLFGFSKSLGHHLWNEISGLASVIAGGLFDNIDGVLIGPFDYFNLGPLLKDNGKQVWKLNAHGVIVLPEQLVAYRNTVVTQEARDLVMNNARRLYPKTTIPMKRSLCFQLRRNWRPWVEEEKGLVKLIRSCAKLWPDFIFFIDGHARSQGAIPVWDDILQLEQESFERIRAQIPDVELRSTIGLELNEKLLIFSKTLLFVGPTGSGGALSSWLLRKPTLCYGPTNTYDMLELQEATVPEGGPLVMAVDKSKIDDLPGEKFPYNVDPSHIFSPIKAFLEKLS